MIVNTSPLQNNSNSTSVAAELEDVVASATCMLRVFALLLRTTSERLASTSEKSEEP